MSASTAAMIKVHRMVAVEIRSRRHSVCISVPDRPCVVGGVEHERIRALSETIQARAVWQTGPKSHVLAFEDQTRSARVEEHLAIIVAAFH